jgi:hypothetical protein
MRSSPRFLVASRSGGDDGWDSDKPPPEGEGQSFSIHRPERPLGDEGAEVTVHLKVSYKTILLVVVVLDFLHLSIREIYSSSWFEQLLGLG